MPPRKYSPTEQLGINAVQQIVLAELGWIWREQYVADFGIDGHIEVVSHEGKPTGQLIAVQVKSGPSYFKGAGPTVQFYAGDEHLKYWGRHVLPVILILHNPENGTTLWQWADLKTARQTKTGWCIDIPKANKFCAASREQLQDQVWSDDSFGLRRRFALDYEFMKEFDKRDAFVTIDLWLNKSLRFREIKVWFDDPGKSTSDYEIPIMATWNYEVSDIMRHFLPWLDYEYHEEPEEYSGEVEQHVFSVSLSRPATAFLELEAYFENPPEPDDDEIVSDGEEDWYDEPWPQDR